MRKLQRPTDQRLALMKNLATNLLWYGRIETTLEKAKEVRTYVEKLLTRAINTYEVLNHTKCIILKDAVAKLEEVYA